MEWLNLKWFYYRTILRLPTMETCIYTTGTPLQEFALLIPEQNLLRFVDWRACYSLWKYKIEGASVILCKGYKETITSPLRDHNLARWIKRVHEEEFYKNLDKAING